MPPKGFLKEHFCLVLGESRVNKYVVKLAIFVFSCSVFPIDQHMVIILDENGHHADISDSIFYKKNQFPYAATLGPFYAFVATKQLPIFVSAHNWNLFCKMSLMYDDLNDLSLEKLAEKYKIELKIAQEVQGKFKKFITFTKSKNFLDLKKFLDQEEIKMFRVLALSKYLTA